MASLTIFDKINAILNNSLNLEYLEQQKHSDELGYMEPEKHSDDSKVIKVESDAYDSECDSALDKSLSSPFFDPKPESQTNEKTPLQFTFKENPITKLSTRPRYRSVENFSGLASPLPCLDFRGRRSEGASPSLDDAIIMSCGSTLDVSKSKETTSDSDAGYATGHKESEDLSELVYRLSACSIEEEQEQVFVKERVLPETPATGMQLPGNEEIDGEVLMYPDEAEEIKVEDEDDGIIFKFPVITGPTAFIAAQEGGASGAGGFSSSLEKAARIHKNGAATHDASVSWSGQLPMRNQKDCQLACKVFLGGVPWDITEFALHNAFKQYGKISIQWPGAKSTIAKGYLYIIFENESQVKALLNSCTQDITSGSSTGNWYFKISSRRIRNKEVQVIPWAIADSNFVRSPSHRLDPQLTVFVGAMHGMINAEGLSNIFNNLFGGVVYAGVDTDRFQYPIGSGRVTFDNVKSFIKAVSAAYIEIKTPKFTKKIQVDPYLEDVLCSSCCLRQGPYFCRDLTCFKYFCRGCWDLNHTGKSVRHHKPLMKKTKPESIRQFKSFRKGQK